MSGVGSGVERIDWSIGFEDEVGFVEGLSFASLGAGTAEVLSGFIVKSRGDVTVKL